MHEHFCHYRERQRMFRRWLDEGGVNSSDEPEAGRIPPVNAMGMAPSARMARSMNDLDAIVEDDKLREFEASRRRRA